MKNLLKIFITIGITLSLFIGFTYNTQAGVTLPDDGVGKIKDSSINTIKSTGNIVQDINDTGMSILMVVKLIFEGVLIIYIVYAGIQMIMSMGSNEDDLSKSKTSLRYSIIGLVFINIPGTLYNAFKQDNYGNIDGKIGYSSWVNTPGDSSNNIFINTFNFGNTLNGDIIGFVEVGLSAIAIFFIVFSGIKIIISRGKEEDYKKSIDKITWSIIGLVFVGFIEAFKRVVFSGDIDDGANLFQTASNLALFFAGPIAIFFLTLAAYYFITANGDEERTKKAKTIVINTVIATVILLACYTFLLDLATL